MRRQQEELETDVWARECELTQTGHRVCQRGPGPGSGSAPVCNPSDGRCVATAFCDITTSHEILTAGFKAEYRAAV